MEYGKEQVSTVSGIPIREVYTPEDTNIDTDRKFITLGLGMMLDTVLSLDVAYMRGSWKESTDDGSINKDRNSNRVFLSAGYRF